MEKYYLERTISKNLYKGYRRQVLALKTDNFIRESDLINASKTFEPTEGVKAKVHVLGLTSFDTSGFDGIKNCNVDNKMDVVVYDKNWCSHRRSVYNAAYIFPTIFSVLEKYRDANKYSNLIKETADNFFDDFEESTINEIKNLPDDTRIYFSVVSYYNYESLNDAVSAGSGCFWYIKRLIDCLISQNIYDDDLMYYINSDGTLTTVEKFLDSEKDKLYVDRYIKYGVNIGDGSIPVVTSSYLSQVYSAKTGYLDMGFEECKQFIELCDNAEKKSAPMILNMLLGYNWDTSLKYVMYAYAIFRYKFGDGYMPQHSKRGKMIYEAMNLKELYYKTSSPVSYYLCFIGRKHIELTDDMYRAYVEPYILDSVKENVAQILSPNYSRYKISDTGIEFNDSFNKFMKEHIK